MNAMVKIIGVVLTLLLALSAVSAVSASGAYYANLCQCETLKETYSVCASTTGVYSVHAAGEVSKWVTVAPSAQTINAGECADFYVFVTPECYATAGTYHPQLIVSGPEDTNTSLEVNVQQCHTFDFTATPQLNSSNPCTENIFNIHAKNTSKFRDEFVLVQNGLPSAWSNYNQEKIILNPYEELNTQLKVKSACNSAPADYSFNLSLSNTRTNSSKSVSLIQRINKFSPLSLSGLFFTDSYYKANTCEEFDKNVVFIATNLSDKSDEITLSLLDSNLNALSRDIAYFENSKFVLDVNKPLQVSLIIKKNSPKTIPVVLRAYSRNFDFSMEANMDIVYSNCYDLNLTSTAGDITSCANTAVQTFEVKNNGTQRMDINVSLNSSSQTLQKQTISLDATSAQMVSFDINNASIGTKQYAVSAVSQYASADTSFNYTVNNCFASSIQADNILVCKQGTVYQKFKLTNSGSQDQDFTVGIDSTWLSFDQMNYSVKAGETKELLLTGLVPNEFANSQVITANSMNTNLSKTVSVITLSNEECNDTNFVVQKAVDANCCAGTVVPLLVGNKGYFEQYVAVNAIVPPWVTISDNNLHLMPSEAKIVYVYLAPPSGTNGDYNALIQLANDRNVTRNAEFVVHVSGTSCGPALEADLNVKNSVSTSKDFTRQEVTVDFVVTNDSNVGFNVNDILVPDYPSTVDFNRGTFLNAKESLTAKITVAFKEGETPQNKEVAVLIKTSVGDFNKTQLLNFSDKEIQGASISGWFSAFSMPLIGLLLLVILILIVLALVSQNNKKPKLRK